MLLALFLIDIAAGLYLFLPLVGRRNAGVKFYRLILITDGALAACAAVAHAIADRRDDTSGGSCSRSGSRAAYCGCCGVRVDRRGQRRVPRR